MSVFEARILGGESGIYALSSAEYIHEGIWVAILPKISEVACSISKYSKDMPDVGDRGRYHRRLTKIILLG
jgi:hypothetical protein